MSFKLLKCGILLLTLFYMPIILRADGGLVAFYKLGAQFGSMDQVQEKINQALVSEKFKIIGHYNPAKDTNLMVITFTRPDLIEITTKYDKRGLMAGIMRVGLIREGDSIEMSLLNPEYLFYAYLKDDVKNIEVELNEISLDIKTAMNLIATDFKPFVISSLSERELKEFKFLVRNPGFEDAVEVMEFTSYESGLEVIQKNLQARKDGTYKVYEVIIKDKKVALFGIGLQDPRKGEANFLKLLGVTHLAALPYELILIDNKASILHGMFRFPLYWSDLTMADYRKIYKTPRDIEETMKSITR
jgi:hypothetical protein